MEHAKLVQGTIRFLALGDSYMIGQGVAEELRWPMQLAGRLREQGIPVADPQIIAQSGWTTTDLAKGINAAHPIGPFSLVALLIGTNNQFRGLNPANYRSEFRALLQRAIALTDGNAKRVIVLSMPDWSVTPFGIAFDATLVGRLIDRFNVANREETRQLGARYVDITPHSRLAAKDLAMLAGDGLHPSGTMYAEWVRLVLPEAVAALHSGRD